MRVQRARAVVRRIGTAANFVVEAAVSTTRPAAMEVAAPNAKKFPSTGREQPLDPLPREIFPPRLCKSLRFMLWSQVMSAVPRSDHRLDGQSDELKKGNTHKISRSSSTRVIARPTRSGGLMSTAGRAPHFSFSSLLPVPGLAGARASTGSVALTRVRRRRTSGRPGESD